VSVELYREVEQIAKGYRSRCPALHIAAHGYSPEVADKNLARAVRLFLAPFQRAGTLREEARTLGLGEIEDIEGLQIVFDQ
jgi:hypothetical protein